LSAAAIRRAGRSSIDRTSRASLIFVQILAGNVILENFVGSDFALAGVRVFYATNDRCLEWFPSSTNSATLSESALWKPDNPCKSPIAGPNGLSAWSEEGKRFVRLIFFA